MTRNLQKEFLLQRKHRMNNLHSVVWCVLLHTFSLQDVHMVDIQLHYGNHDRQDDRMYVFDCICNYMLVAEYHMESVVG